MQKLLNLFKGNDAVKYLIATVLIIVPLYPKFPLFNISGTYVAIRFEDLILLLLGLATIFGIFKDPLNFFKDKLVWPFIVFFFIGFASLVSGIWVTKTVDLHIGLLHLLRRIEYVVPFFAMITLFKNNNLSKSLSYYLTVLLFVTLVLFIYGVGQKYLSFPIIITQNQEYSKGVALRYTPGSHINSTFAGHYDLASFMVLILPVIISLFFTIKGKISKTALTVSFIVCLWLLVNSLSRIAQISYLVSVGVSMILLKKYKEMFVVFAISLVFILSSAGLYQRFSRFFNVYAADETVIPVQTPVEVFEDRSTNIRLAVEWPRAIRSFLKNPLLGTGYSSINLATDNDYLRALGEIGILGFFAFVYIFVSLFKEFTRFKFGTNLIGLEKGFVVGIVGATLGTLLTATFIDIFEASKFATMYWLFMGMAINLVRNYKNVQKN